MTNHNTCPHCGHETHCTRRWVDKHAAAAVTAGLFTLMFISMMLSTHPVAAVAVITLAGIGGIAYRFDQERQRREALAARADAEHQALVAAPVSPVRPLPQRQVHSLPWQLVHLLRTEPLRIGRRA